MGYFFSGLEVPNINTIDEFISKLTNFVKEDPNNPIVSTIRNTVSQLDVQA